VKPILYFSSYGGTGYRVDNGTVAAYFKDGSLKNAYHSDGFQLISPGFDYEYGSGGTLDNEDQNGNATLDGDTTKNNGVFTEDVNDNGILDTKTSQVLSNTRAVEKDNITNFHTGELGDKE
jgi:hypothetical protein